MPPTVILVEPETPANIGMVARTCKAAGVSDLRLVHPEWAEVPDRARQTGAAALEVLDAARLFPTLAAALADAALAVAFSRRSFADQDECWLRELPRLLPARSDELTTALVFGRESQGLRVEEVKLCHLVCAIPIRGTLSDNLGQAVAIALYELCRREEAIARPQESEPRQLAPLEQLQALGELIARLGGDDYAVDSRRGRQLRQLLQRSRPGESELNSLFGLLHAIARPR